ncbi:MAG: YdbL family protein [Thiogranum sp.]|jgi:uncharacterized protein YdbL (DUF1318 family)
MISIRISSLLGMLMFLAACVTINVYFPSAAAEQAADRIIRGVYGEETGKPDTAPAQKPGPDSLLDLPAARPPVLIGLLEWLVSPAQAAADINIQSPAIQTIRASMEARFPQLKPYFASGSVGMTNNGLVEVRDLNAVALRERKSVKTLVADENRDRNALYVEIARANGHPEWEADIRKTFAARWIANAPAGWWYQNAGGQWQRK